MQAVVEGRCSHHKGFKCKLLKDKMKTQRLNDKEREDWINSDEGLYNRWKQSRIGITAFIRANRAEIDTVINNVVNGVKPAHYLAYGK